MNGYMTQILTRAIDWTAFSLSDAIAVWASAYGTSLNQASGSGGGGSHPNASATSTDLSGILAWSAGMIKVSSQFLHTAIASSLLGFHNSTFENPKRSYLLVFRWYECWSFCLRSIIFSLIAVSVQNYESQYTTLIWYTSPRNHL